MKLLSFPISAKSTVIELQKSGVFDVLIGTGELVVYVRLLAEVEEQKTRRVKVFNHRLHPNRGGRTAAVALQKLQEDGLIKIRGKSVLDRTIEVIR